MTLFHVSYSLILHIFKAYSISIESLRLASLVYLSRSLKLFLQLLQHILVLLHFMAVKSLPLSEVHYLVRSIWFLQIVVKVRVDLFATGKPLLNFVGLHLQFVQLHSYFGAFWGLCVYLLRLLRHPSAPCLLNLNRIVVGL